MKPFTVFVPAILLLACLALPCTALESKVLTVTEKTLSVDLGPSFEIYGGEFNASEKGMVSSDFVINNTATAGAAFVSVMSVYDEMMSKMSPGALSELFLIGGISAVEARGDTETGNWTAVDSQGRNVTVYTHGHKGSARSNARRQLRHSRLEPGQIHLCRDGIAV
jgi:hypothetical protein